jgi:hypothetical protein
VDAEVYYDFAADATDPARRKELCVYRTLWQLYLSDFRQSKSDVFEKKARYYEQQYNRLLTLLRSRRGRGPISGTIAPVPQQYPGRPWPWS